MKNEILKLVKDKHTGTSGTGEKIYSNLTEADLNKIIAASISAVVERLESKINTASDEWETVSFVEQELSDLKTEFGNKKSKNKIK
jgi:hypothetical protein